MSRLTVTVRMVKQAGNSAIWLGRRLLLWWLAAYGFMAVFTACPFCGKPGCITGAGLYATVISPIMAFFSWKARMRRKSERPVSDKSTPADDSETTRRYIASCRNEFWQEVFRLELKYLLDHLAGCRDVLSVGCGPAVIEGELAKHGFNVTGLDVSQEALDCASNQVRTVVARAEDMPFPGLSFDAIIYVVSLQFIEDYRQALEKSASILRPNGRIIVMLLNPKSVFFKERLRDHDSYVLRIRHIDTHQLERALAERFQTRAEYFLGVKQGKFSESRDPDCAVLYVINGTKLLIEAERQKS